MTQFVMTPGGKEFKQSFLQQLVSIHFPAGVLVRVSFTGSGSNTVAKPSIKFPFGDFPMPLLNYSASFTGISPPIEDPPTALMIKNLYAWSILNDQGNFVYFNTDFVQSKFKDYSPVVITSPAFTGIPPFASTRIVVWYYGSATHPTGPFDPIVFSQGGGWLASFDPTAGSVYTAAQILAFINEVAQGNATPGVGGVPFIPVNDGGDATKGAQLVSDLASSSRLPLLSPGGNVYVATSITNNQTAQNAGWGLQSSMFSIKGGTFNPAPLAHVSDFKLGTNGGTVPAVVITLTIDAVKHTLIESKH